MPQCHRQTPRGQCHQCGDGPLGRDDWCMAGEPESSSRCRRLHLWRGRKAPAQSVTPEGSRMSLTSNALQDEDVSVGAIDEQCVLLFYIPEGRLVGALQHAKQDRMPFFTSQDCNIAVRPRSLASSQAIVVWMRASSRLRCLPAACQQALQRSTSGRMIAVYAAPAGSSL